MRKVTWHGRTRSPGQPARRKRSISREYIVPKWGALRLNQIQPKAVEDWLHTTFDSWWTMHGVRAIMTRIYNYAEGHGLVGRRKAKPVEQSETRQETAQTRAPDPFVRGDRARARPHRRAVQADYRNLHRHRRTDLRSPRAEVEAREPRRSHDQN